MALLKLHSMVLGSQNSSRDSGVLGCALSLLVGASSYKDGRLGQLVFSALDVPPWFQTVTYWQVSGVLNGFTNRSRELAGFICRCASRWSVDWTSLFLMRISYIVLLAG